MTKVKIEKGIPMPDTSEHGNTKYPFHELEIGDSFLCNSRWSHQLCSDRSRNGKKFIARKQPDGRYRIWRIPVPTQDPFHGEAK